VRSSDGKARLGHISRQGSAALRWAFVEAAPEGKPVRRAAAQQLRAVAKRRGRKIAKVAIASKILTLCSYARRDGEIRCLAARPDG
jgi:transposase